MLRVTLLYIAEKLMVQDFFYKFHVKQFTLSMSHTKTHASLCPKSKLPHTHVYVVDCDVSLLLFANGLCNCCRSHIGEFSPCKETRCVTVTSWSCC